MRVPCLLLAFLTFLGCGAAAALPRVPSDDAEVVETLPAVSGWSLEQRRALRELVKRPRDSAVALQAARAYLDLARSQGDARYAGYAMGALQAWQPMSAATPERILVMHATVAQYLHDFDGAETTLKLALKANAGDAQGWLTLATILRVRGRYAESDEACRHLQPLGQTLYASACLAKENRRLAWRIHGSARQHLQTLLADPRLQGRNAGSDAAMVVDDGCRDRRVGRPAL